MIGAAVSGSNGHCIALNNIGNYLTSNSQMERSKLLVDFPNNENSNIISSEGCFACDMNKVNKRQNRRVAGPKNDGNRRGRGGRRLRNRANVLGRKRRHKRNHQNPLSPENGSTYARSSRKGRQKRHSSRHYMPSEIPEYNTQFRSDVSPGIENTTINKFHTISLDLSKAPIKSAKRLSNSITNATLLAYKHPVKRLAITLSREETRKNRYGWFLLHCYIIIDKIDFLIQIYF